MQATDTQLSRRKFLMLAGSTLVVSVLPLPLLSSSAQAAADPTDLLNAIRAQSGLGKMTTNQKLEQAALYQAKRMASHGKMGHSIGWGNGFGARLIQAGIRGAAAENVAVGQRDTAAVFDAWMKSPGHRKNMLDPVFTHYGLAWATPENNPRRIYWAMMFGV